MASAGDRLRWWKAEIEDLEATRRTLRSIAPDVVFHLASHVYGSRALEQVVPCLIANLVTTVNVLTVATELGGVRVVVSGSLDEPDSEEGLLTVASPYSVSKWGARAYAQMFHALYGTPVVYTRIGMVYGPGQRDLNKLVPYATLALLRGQAPKLSSGTRRADWSYVEDIADALVAAATAPGVFEAPIELGAGVLTSVRDVVLELQRLIPNSPEPAFGEVSERPFEPNRAADLRAASTCLGYEPKVSLRTGLRRTVEYYASCLKEGAI